MSELHEVRTAERIERVEHELAAHGTERIFSFFDEESNRTVYVKQAEPVHNAAWLRFSRWATITLGLGILQPGADPDGEKALRLEAGRLRRLQDRGISVPEVYAAGYNWIALYDAGENAAVCIRKDVCSYEEKRRLIVAAAENLASLHSMGLHHGRPHLKDMLWDGETISLLDFEDGYLIDVAREKRIMRDLLLFLQSIYKEAAEAGKDCGPELAQLAFSTYAAKETYYASYAKKYFGDLSVLYLLLGILRCAGSDLESVYQTLKLFRQA
ncbi:hypothetical protein TAMA11512_01320 [Selenomonas sp. TAMA-11512]|uniref:hypothetical protein n=1 Tax=Selenomonas sp. TAMA-11512 TaxID=3095337 RepID=UPI00308DC391|nr:hypothetical protein TAMA11512_01320 [Selenomonas sp. TAMA-11512]